MKLGNIGFGFSDVRNVNLINCSSCMCVLISWSNYNQTCHKCEIQSRKKHYGDKAPLFPKRLRVEEVTIKNNKKTVDISVK